MPKRKHPLLIVLALALLLQAWVGVRMVHAQHKAGLPTATAASTMPCHGPAQEGHPQAQEKAAGKGHAHPAETHSSAAPDSPAAMADCDHFSCCLALAGWTAAQSMALSRPSDQAVQPEHGLLGQHPAPELRPPI